MPSLTTAIVAAATVLCPGLATQDATKLARTYQADEAGVILIKVNADAKYGQKIEASANVQMKVAKLLENGIARLSCSLGNLKVAIEGSDMPFEAPAFEADCDAQGLPDHLVTNQVEWMYTLTFLAGIVPNKEMKVGESSEFEWNGKDKANRIKGKIKLVELVELDGVKAAKVESDMTVYPQDQNNPGHVTSTSWIALSNGRLIKSEGKLAVEGDVQATFTTTRVK